MEKGLFIRNLDKKYNLVKIDYLYLWDADCDFKFISLFNDKDFFKKIKIYKKKYVLVTPIFSRENYNKFKNLLYENKEEFLFLNFEFVVNSWGIYFLLTEVFKTKIKIIWWKRMYVQIKDPMVKKIDNKFKWNINIDFAFYQKFFHNNLIWWLELVNLEENFCIYNLKLPFHFYYPKVSFSSIKYCYSWNLYKWNKTLQVVDNCDWCNGKSIKYSFDYLWDKITHESNTFSYNNYSIWNINDKASRLIYNYFE